MPLPTPPDRSPSPVRQVDPVFIWPVPEEADRLFWVEKDMRLPKDRSFTYGQPYWDAVTYPDHKLVYVTPQDERNVSRWFFASDRTNEDNYNWEVAQGRQLIRTYLVKRSLYRQKRFDAAGLLAGEFTYPAVATADTLFPDYGFADDTQVRTDTELDSTYVIIRRRFIEPTTVEYRYSEELRRYVKIQRDLVEPTTAAPSIPEDGSRVEHIHGNKFHDVKVTQTVMWDTGGVGGDISWLASTRKKTINFNFPPQLVSAELFYAYAYAADADSSPAYSEDFFIDYKLVDPRRGPYEATVEVYYVKDEADLLAANPVDVIPSPEREAIPIMYWWASAGPLGNKTQAYAKQWEIPSSVHDAITISLSPNSGTGTGAIGNTRYGKASLPATAGFAAFKTKSTIILEREVEDIDFGLKRVTITKLDVSGIYT